MKKYVLGALSLGLIALMGFFVSQLLRYNFSISQQGIFIFNKQLCYLLSFKKLILPALCFLLQHFILRVTLIVVTDRIKLNLINKTSVYKILAGIIFALIFDIILCGNSIDPVSFVQGTDVNWAIKTMICLSFLLSIVIYQLIDKVYHLYLDKFCSISTTQLKTLKLQAVFLKRLCFVFSVLTGWALIPLLYLFYICKRAEKKLK